MCTIMLEPIYVMVNIVETQYDLVLVILTGDKDFLESGITDPRIVSPREFLK